MKDDHFFDNVRIDINHYFLLTIIPVMFVISQNQEMVNAISSAIPH